MVDHKFRKQGIARQLVENACEMLNKQGIKFIRLFTSDDHLFSSLLRGLADPVNISTELITDELNALRLIEKKRGYKKGLYGTNRIVSKYYALRDGNTLNATFKMYKI